MDNGLERREQWLSTPSLQQLPYSLASLVYAAATRRGVVFLDLRNNTYSGIDIRTAHALANCVHGLPNAESASSEYEPTALASDVQKTADALLASGVITHGPDPRPSFLSRSVSTKGDLIAIGDEVEYDVPIQAHHIANFMSACTVANLSLKHRPLQKVVAAVHERRRQSKDTAFDPVQAGKLVSVFRRLRPFIFTARGRCLFHALALTTFLRHYDLYPAWVIGVRTDPWGAHSWVQEGDFVLDTNPEKVCEFTPILAV